MLILMREIDNKDKNTIVITASNGDLIKVHLLTERGNQIKVGIDADKSVVIMRNELINQCL